MAGAEATFEACGLRRVERHADVRPCHVVLPFEHLAMGVEPSNSSAIGKIEIEPQGMPAGRETANEGSEQRIATHPRHGRDASEIRGAWRTFRPGSDRRGGGEE